MTPLLGLLLLTGCSRGSGKQLIVLGVDGMDPAFLERHWSALPNLHRLSGGMTRLRTTMPPQSPVAWSTFSTGLPPAEHGIFDFVLRESGTGRDVSSMGESLPPRWQLGFGPWVLPMSQGRVRSFRQGTTFWELLDRAGLPVTMVRMPVNYPPVKAGRAISGMGTPDLAGTFGTSQVYTDQSVLRVEGPPDPVRKDGRKLQEEVRLDVDPEESVVRAAIQDQVVVLTTGEWSPWLRVRFGAVAGMFRLYVQELHPHVRIYRSPLNADPSHAALDISRPASFSRDVAARIGPFYTQGIPEDTAATRQGLLSVQEYLTQSHLAAAEENRMLDDCLRHFESGLLFFYFSEVDQDSHILWDRYEEELLRTYQGVDRAIGRSLDRAPHADVMVMSDHGFARFDEAVNLNAWFSQQRLPAAAVGLNSVFVKDKAHIGEVKAKLEAWVDPVSGGRVVSSVHTVGKSWSRFAPDLIVGYAAGYRAAWEGAQENQPATISPNTDPWVGDHCIDSTLVPGVLLGTRKSALTDPGLEDLTVTILREFGVTPEAAMKGRMAWRNQ